MIGTPLHENPKARAADFEDNYNNETAEADVNWSKLYRQHKNSLNGRNN